MQLGEVIRKYRKSNNMTQEEMASRLGVTAPAVNKWEKGNSFPDIMLLAPIARLLDVSLDTLLAFREELTAEEIKDIIYEMDLKLKEQPYEEVFQWAKKKLEEYPNCEQLIWQIAVVLDAQCSLKKITNKEKYDEYIHTLYVRALKSNDETIRNSAADSLFNYYIKKGQYSKAEEYLEYFSKQNPERKRKQAQIYSKTNRIQEAYKTYEELLFANYQMVSAAVHGIYMLAMQEHNMEKAHRMADKQEEISKCFEMGKYYEVSGKLEIATIEKDVETVITIVKDMLSGVEHLGSFRSSPLYEHMEFREIRKEFLSDMKTNLLNSFRDEQNYGFLKDDKRWQEIIK